MRYVQLSEGAFRWFAPLACCPGSPELSTSYSSTASKLLTFTVLRLRTGSDFAPARLPAPDPVSHMSAPVRRGAVADARLGLA